MIPKVKLWKVAVSGTDEYVLVETINRSFARAIAIQDHGMWGKPLKVSLYRGPFSKDYRAYGFSQPTGLDGAFCCD